MLKPPPQQGEGTISGTDTWRTIRWNRRLFFSLPLLLGLGLVLGTWLFPTLEFQDLLERVGIVVVILGWVLAFWPAPCPQCRQPFLIWSIQNWPYWFRVYLKNTFAPFRYLDQVFNGPCPNCGLSLGAEPEKR
jgi:hypothetical protein